MGNDRIICLNNDLLRWFDQEITDQDDILEYGCGYSTLWFADRARAVVSVEHNVTWASLINDLREPEQEFMISIEHRPANYPYIITARTFQFVLVDGIERAACVEHAWPLVNSGGWLILDDAQRGEYASVHHAMMQRTDFNVHFGPALSDLPSVHESGRVAVAWRKP